MTAVFLEHHTHRDRLANVPDRHPVRPGKMGQTCDPFTQLNLRLPQHLFQSQRIQSHLGADTSDE